MKRIQILGPGCARCNTLAENAQTAARELGVDATVEKITDVDAILEFGVLMTPALAIDGQVKLVGTVPSLEEIKGVLREGMRDEG